MKFNNKKIEKARTSSLFLLGSNGSCLTNIGRIILDI
nr:MAG TPA: hypothetical protein [Caudoviricetes sp.]